MAIVLGTSSGFVSVAPSSDPAGSALYADNYSNITKHVTPSTATTITEVGWYCGTNANKSPNFEVGLYDDLGDEGNAKELLEVDRTNTLSSGTGWKVVTGLNWSVTGNTNYHLGVQVDNTSGATRIDVATSGGSGYDNDSSQTTLPDPWRRWEYSHIDTNGMFAIYALWSAAATGTDFQVNIGDDWKDVSAMQINIGDVWKAVAGAQVNIGDTWKDVTI